MKKIFYIIIMIFGLFSSSKASYNTLAYEYSFTNINGNKINLADYNDKIIVVVNVASRCGFTPQYDGLQKLWTSYKDKDLIIIGVPTNNFNQEPGNNKEIKEFCETNFGINFPMSEKISVLGNNAHPFFKWAKENHGKSAIPKWNFHKIIIDKEGKIVKTFSSFTNPSSKKFIDFIETQLNN